MLKPGKLYKAVLGIERFSLPIYERPPSSFLRPATIGHIIEGDMLVVVAEFEYYYKVLTERCYGWIDFNNNNNFLKEV